MTTLRIHAQHLDVFVTQDEPAVPKAEDKPAVKEAVPLQECATHRCQRLSYYLDKCVRTRGTCLPGHRMSLFVEPRANGFVVTDSDTGGGSLAGGWTGASLHMAVALLHWHCWCRGTVGALRRRVVEQHAPGHALWTTHCRGTDMLPSSHRAKPYMQGPRKCGLGAGRS